MRHFDIQRHGVDAAVGCSATSASRVCVLVNCSVFEASLPSMVFGSFKRLCLCSGYSILSGSFGVCVTTSTLRWLLRLLLFCFGKLR